MLTHKVKLSLPKKHLRSKLHYKVTSLPQATSLAQRANLVEKGSDCITIRAFFWQGHKDLNPEPTVLETAALPIELYPYIYFKGRSLVFMVGPQGFEPGTIRL